MSEPVRKVDESYTYADLLTWPEDQRCELIDGMLYNMTPTPGLYHQEIIGEFHVQFHNYLRHHRPCRVFLPPCDVRLPKRDENGLTSSTVVQPDLIVVCDQQKLDKRGVVGAPDLVVEVLSPYTAKMDRQQKKHIYVQAGVREYWIVSPSEKTVEVYQLQEQRRYGEATVYQYNEQVPVGMLPGLVIDLTQVFAEEEETTSNE